MTTVESAVEEIVAHEIHGPPPLQEGQEWANALTHAIGATATVALGSVMMIEAVARSSTLAIACGVYLASVFGTFLFSTLSHIVRRQPLLNTMRAWDQAMIYAMIAGTYTPIIYGCATPSTQSWLFPALWVAAGFGFYHKVAVRHRINSIGSISYLLLGWLPAIPLAGYVPRELVWMMLGGGAMYTIGVVVLMNDTRFKYLHALWHICVMTAAVMHFYGIMIYVVGS